MKPKEQPKMDISKVLEQYVKTKSGVVFHVLQNPNNKTMVFLRRKNIYLKKKWVEIRQAIVDGSYAMVNEHEWRKFVKEDNEWIEKYRLKLVKRVILAQLLLELDDELIEDNDQDKRFRAVLERSNKETERIAAKQYEQLYEVDKTMLQNIMNKVDDFTGMCAGLRVDDLVVVTDMVKKYIDNPEPFKEEPIEFVKING